MDIKYLLQYHIWTFSQRIEPFLARQKTHPFWKTTLIEYKYRANGWEYSFSLYLNDQVLLYSNNMQVFKSIFFNPVELDE